MPAAVTCENQAVPRTHARAESSSVEEYRLKVGLVEALGKLFLLGVTQVDGVAHVAERHRAPGARVPTQVHALRYVVEDCLRVYVCGARLVRCF